MSKSLRFQLGSNALMKAFRLAIFLGLLYMKVAAVQQASISSLEGIAIKWRTGEPVRNVSVEFRALTGEKLSIPAALSSEDGRFVFPSVPPGKYRLVGMSPGYLKSEFGQLFYGGPTQEVTLSIGQQISGVRLVMTPGAVITGRITSGGKPAAAADVYAVKASNIDGKLAASLVLSAKTNDLGDFSIFWLPPGSYYIAAVVSNRGTGARNILINVDGEDRHSLHEQGGASRITASPPEPDSGGAEAFVPMYFPNTPDILTARLVEVTPGTEIRNIDIDSRPLPAYHVRGRIAGGIPLGPAGQPTRVMVMLDNPLNVFFGEGGGDVLNSGGMRFAVAEPNGLFDISRVSPGSYVLSLRDAMRGSMPLEVRGEVNDLIVFPLQTVRPSARVVIEGLASADTTSVAIRTFVTLMSKSSAAWDRYPELHRLVGTADGSHRLQNGAPGIPVGDYRVFVEPILTPPTVNALAPASPTFQKMYVKSIRLGDVDVLREGLRLQSQPADPIQVVLGMNPGVLEGHVLNERSELVPRVWVALLPDGGRRFRSAYEFTSSDATGLFQIDNVPPGEYKLFAWEEAQRGEWEDPAFMQKYESLGTPIRIEEGRKSIVDAIAIPSRR